MLVNGSVVASYKKNTPDFAARGLGVFRGGRKAIGLPARVYLLNCW